MFMKSDGVKKNANKIVKQLNCFNLELNFFSRGRTRPFVCGMKIIWYGSGYNGDSWEHTTLKLFWRRGMWRRYCDSGFNDIRFMGNHSQLINQDHGYKKIITFDVNKAWNSQGFINKCNAVESMELVENDQVDFKKYFGDKNL